MLAILILKKMLLVISLFNLEVGFDMLVAMVLIIKDMVSNKLILALKKGGVISSTIFQFKGRL